VDPSYTTRVLLDNYYLPADLKRQIAVFMEHCNHFCYHENIGRLTFTSAGPR
jgi:putative transposase